MAWRLSGLEYVGEDFSVSQDVGIVNPRTEFVVHLYLKARKAVNIKKMIRLEVRGPMPTLAEQGREISPVLLGMEIVLEVGKG